MRAGLTFTDIKKKIVNVVEKWAKWWDLSISNNMFEIVEESSGCNSVNFIKKSIKYKGSWCNSEK